MAAALAATALGLCLATPAYAAERITWSSGFEQDFSRHATVGDKVRLFALSSAPNDDTNYMDVRPESIAKIEAIPDPPPPSIAERAAKKAVAAAEPTLAELHEMLSHAGSEHHIDAELLASLVHAESGYRTHAISRTGALGLMQLMPGTASAVGVHDAFAAADNVEGGTRYFDQMLTRYHDNIALALAAYNAGPGAVDRYHGVPPYRETRAYVARVIREFNARKTAALKIHPALLAQGH